MVADRGTPADTFRELFAAHASYVWNVLRRFRAREADLADLTHEVFVVLHRHLEDGSLDLDRPIRPWLGATAFRVASVHRRSASARREVLDGEAGGVVADPTAGPEQAASAAEDRELLLRALEGLSDDRRAVVILHDLEETAMPEVAEALGLPLNTAYSRLRLARADLAIAVRRLRPRTRRGVTTEDRRAP
jgi:RNA polymerase sigma-70 factor (ECF subfamily)